jgi:CRP-like cAMP-binding protein
MVEIASRLLRKGEVGTLREAAETLGVEPAVLKKFVMANGQRRKEVGRNQGHESAAAKIDRALAMLDEPSKKPQLVAKELGISIRSLQRQMHNRSKESVISGRDKRKNTPRE